MSALVPDAPEWGAMLASSRTVEILWATRWIIFVPGAAFALPAIAVAAIGFALARRYARRDLFEDGRAAAVVVIGMVALFAVSTVVPERYAEAREWSTAARSEVRSTGDLTNAFEQAGLRTYSAVRHDVDIVRSGPATVAIGGGSGAEIYPGPVNPPIGVGQEEALVRV